MNLTKYLGVYDSLEAVWQSYPGGGVEGDYVLAGGKVYGWNIFEKNWTVPDIAPSMSEVRKTETVYGDMHVHHDLSVGGILRARVVRGRNAFCGLFASAAALEKHYADPYIGQWALVAFDSRTDDDGNAIGKIYACEQDGVWKDTGQNGGYDGTLYEALQTEREERMEVDADIIVLISNETEAREEADEALLENINAEAKLRREADEALQRLLDGIDLSEHVTKIELATELEGYAKKDDIPEIPKLKTINGESIIGEGDIKIECGGQTEGDFQTIVPFGGFDTMDTDIYDDIYVWSSDESYPPEQIKYIAGKFMVKLSVKEFYDKWKGSDVYNEYDGNTAQSVRKDKIFLYDKSLYAWDKYKQDLSEIIPEPKGSSGDGGNTPNGAESVYTPTISEATGITNAIGSISTDMVLGDLKGKSISKIIEMMLIAETWYNPKYEHNINMSSIPTLVKVGSTVQFPNATAVWNANIIPNEGVPGNIKLSHEAQINYAPITWGADMNYTTSGMATFEVGYDYGGGYYTITSNLGNSKIIEVSENTGTLTTSVDITYPWFINSIEQPLVKIGDSYTVTKILGGQPSIKVPFANSEITVQVDLGFGYMDVEWEESLDESNLGGAIDETVPYKVLTKPDSYNNDVPHKITIKINKE